MTALAYIVLSAKKINHTKNKALKKKKIPQAFRPKTKSTHKNNHTTLISGSSAVKMWILALSRQGVYNSLRHKHVFLYHVIPIRSFSQQKFPHRKDRHD